MGSTWQVHTLVALGVVVTCAAVVTGLSPPDGAALSTSGAAARNVTVKSGGGGGGGGSSYHHVWPPMRFGWRIVLGSVIGFIGAAFGSIGGVGGGGIYVPMLVLIIRFDPKSGTAMSKCMITGAAISAVYYNLRRRHPTLDQPLVDFDLAVLIQPMLMLGISIGVILNVIFPEWLVTALLIVLFLVTATRAYIKGVETWKNETITKREAAKRMEQMRQEPQHATSIPIEPADAANTKSPQSDRPILENVYWKEFGLLASVWIAFLGLQIAKNYTSSCSVLYWVLSCLQIPVSAGMSMYQARRLISGKRVLSSKGSQQSTLKPLQLFVYCIFGILAGLVGGLLGLGGGFIMGPMFLELGIHPQVASATATFVMMFSSSMSVIEYYLLHRFPVPYAAYLAAVAFIAAIISQYCIRRLVIWLGRASIIIFILASMILVSAFCLGGEGIANIVNKMEQHQYMGFETETLCS